MTPDPTALSRFCAELGVKAPATLSELVERTVDLHRKFNDYEKPYRRGELVDELLEEILAGIETGEDPAASTKVAQLQARIALHEANLPGRALQSALGAIEARLTEPQVVNEFLATLAAPAAEAFEGHVLAARVLGHDYTPADTGALNKGQEAAAAWLQARASNETWRVLVDAWSAIGRMPVPAMERVLAFVRPADSRDYSAMFTYPNGTPRSWHDANRGEFGFYEAALAGWVVDVADQHEVASRREAATAWWSNRPTTQAVAKGAPVPNQVTLADIVDVL